MQISNLRQKLFVKKKLLQFNASKRKIRGKGLSKKKI